MIVRSLAAVQLSLAVRASDWVEVHTPASVLTVALEGQVIVGSVVSDTVISSEQVAVLLRVSVTVKVTVVVPVG